MFFLYKYFNLLVQCIPIILIIVIGKYYYVRRRFFILASRLPGPRSLPLIGNALDFAGKGLDCFAVILKYTKKNDITAHWIGHNLHVLISRPEDAEVLFTSPYLQDKSYDYKYLATFLGKGLITANGDVWYKARKWVEPCFSYSSLQNLGDIYEEKTNILIELLQKEDRGPTFSIFPYVKNCAIDIICEATTPLGVKPQEEKIHPFDHTEDLLAAVSARGYNMLHYPDIIYKHSKEGKDYFRKLRCLKGFLKTKLHERKELLRMKKMDVSQENGEGKKMILFDRLIENKEWDDEEILDHLLTIMGAAYETSTNSICYVLMMLGMHKDVQEKLYNELLNAYNEGLEDKDLQRVKYLDMVIKESMRLFTIVPLSMRQASQDVQMGKHLIPKGAAVMLNTFSLHRDPNQYEHPDAFYPDHFLPENVKKRHPYSFVPFTAGSRKCIGYRIAMMTMRSLIAKIVCNFKIECDLKFEELKLAERITLRTHDELYPIRIIGR